MVSRSKGFTPPKLHDRFAPSRTLLKADILSNLFGWGAQSSSSSRTVFEIPAINVKVGAIRFLLNIHLVAFQNKPEKGTWFPKQGSSDDLDFYFKDGSAKLSLSFSEYAIKAERLGVKPSRLYLIQESVLLHEVLDELNKLAFEVDNVEGDKKLLQLKDSDSIEKARAKLPPRVQGWTKWNWI